MRCPVCGENTEVLKTRCAGIGMVVRRRRSCKCGNRFTTRETIVVEEVAVEDIPEIKEAIPVPESKEAVKISPPSSRKRKADDEFNPFDEDSCFLPEY